MAVMALLYVVFLTKNLIFLTMHENNMMENTIQQACRKHAGKKGNGKTRVTEASA